MPREETVFSEDTSFLFKETRVSRIWDAKRNTLVYLAISRKVIEGAPANSVSSGAGDAVALSAANNPLLALLRNLAVLRRPVCVRGVLYATLCTLARQAYPPSSAARVFSASSSACFC